MLYFVEVYVSPAFVVLTEYMLFHAILLPFIPNV